MSTDVIKQDTLAGVKVLELSAIGPVPWGTLLLSRMGAQVTRIVRPGSRTDMPDHERKLADIGRTDVALDLKSEAGKAAAQELVRTHHILLEGMRPGVMERLGLGPDDCHAINPKLVYGRMTGWGQNGPLADRAGHDINYIALSGALSAIGPKDGPPSIPLNLVGDFGGGGTFMIIGVLGALFKAGVTGKGSVVDISMVEGAATLMAPIYERFSLGEWKDQRGSNRLDGGFPWYCIYQTQCGGYMAVGALEPQFYRELLRGLGFDEATFPSRDDAANWPEIRRLFTEKFLSRTRDQWAQVFDPTDACVSPVLSLAEAPQHPHNQQRQVFYKDAAGILRPNVAPRVTGF
ncbi:MAG: CaiB/BaiF CoA transferase family protein [Burkholderiaceae bacterium]